MINLILEGAGGSSFHQVKSPGGSQSKISQCDLTPKLVKEFQCGGYDIKCIPSIDCY